MRFPVRGAARRAPRASARPRRCVMLLGPAVSNDMESAPMVRKVLTVLLALFTLTAAVTAQSVDETKFREKQADVLHKYAASAHKSGFPQVAKRVWLMLLSEYQPDHPDAREALGYRKVGPSWALDPEFVYPKNDAPDPKAASKLQEQWTDVAGKLAKAHLATAEEYEKAGRTDMARWHFEKVIYFTPQD